MSYKEDDHMNNSSSVTRSQLFMNDAGNQMGSESDDKYAMKPIFDIRERQRKFNAYLVDEEHLMPTQDNNDENSEYGIALNAYADKIISIEEQDLQQDVENDFEAHPLDENGLDNYDNTGNNEETHTGTENDEDVARPMFYKETSFRRTCFPQLWARS